MRNSLAKRLTYRIMAVILVMVTVITGIVYYTVRAYMLKEAQERYLGVLAKMQDGLQRRLSDVNVAVKNNIHDIERDIDEPDKMFGHLERIVSLNPGITYSLLMFTPNYYPEKGQYFVPEAKRDSSMAVRVMTDDNVKGYERGSWFRRGISQDTGAWIGNYIDKHAISDSRRRHLEASYATPIHDRQGKPVAMLSVELSLQSVQQMMMEDLKVVNEAYEKDHRHKSYCFVVDQEGTYIIHPDKKRMLSSSYLEQAKNTTDTLDDRVVLRMMKGEVGKAMLTVDNVPSWIYYRAIKNTDWTIAIVVPKEVIFYNGRMLNAIILAVMLAGLVAIYFVCRRMIRDITTPVTVAQAAIDREMKIAHGIQMAMLPKTFPPYPERTDIDLYASVTPARDVGGDLYDYFLRDDRLYFCIGDVSGKGVPAALLMAVMRAMFRSETRRADSAAAIVDTMNRNLSEEYTASYFVTMFVGILDLATGHLDYCNAGHEPPLLAGQPLPVKPNLPIGALSDWNYEGQQAQMQSGDMLFLYTDGLSEARNHSDQQLGRQHVLELVSQHTADTAQQLVQLMENEVHRHAADAIQSDDITLLAVKWNSSMLTIQASMAEIERLQPYIEQVARQAGIDSKQTKRLRLAVEEAVVNVINYGQATTITLSALLTPHTALRITIDDDGLPFDPTKDSDTDLSIPADQRPPGGMGIVLLHKMTDGLSYQRTGGHNVLTLIKHV